MPRTANAVTRELARAVRAGIARNARVVLAVSGGADSMALLDAVAAWRRGAIACVATFDHGTGEAATAAAALVRDAAHALGLPLAHGQARGLPASEAAWREARWAFLRETAELVEARVATGHTRDDQIETVLIRALRGAGPRGLAGLYAEGDRARPLLDVPRRVVRAYVVERGLPFLDDPSNTSHRFLRNRVRLDLLPALERARPGFGAWLLSLSRRAAAWRADVEAFVDTFALTREGRTVFLPVGAFAGFDAQALRLLWPAIAARAGVTLDRRGTERLAALVTARGVHARVPLSGGHEVIRHRTTFEIRPAARP